MTDAERTAYVDRRYEAARRLRDKSVLVFGVERVFRALQVCSPASYLGGPRTDVYLVAWLFGAIVLVAFWNHFSPSLLGTMSFLVVLLAGIRILDITQAVVNLGLFDHLGSSSDALRRQEVANVTRSVVLLIWDFVELIIWFGVLYLPFHFQTPVTSFWSRLYFSGITQLTIGYGDLTPLGWAKGVAMLQSVLGWLVTVIVIVRFVSALPQISERSDGAA